MRGIILMNVDAGEFTLDELKQFVDELNKKYEEANHPHPKICFLFGDNMVGRGKGGLAKLLRDIEQDIENVTSIGIPTKWKPARTQDAYFTDKDLFKVMPAIFKSLQRISEFLQEENSVLVIPAHENTDIAIGTGLAELDKRAPAIRDFIQTMIKLIITTVANPNINLVGVGMIAKKKEQNTRPNNDDIVPLSTTVQA